MPTYPTFSGGRTFMSPLVRVNEIKVRTLEFANLQQQRFRVAPKLTRFLLTHLGLSASDMTTLRSFFDARKGGYAEFDITVNGVLYEHMVFDTHELFVTEPDATPTRFATTVNLRQVR